jgi:hypothetical protein
MLQQDLNIEHSSEDFVGAMCCDLLTIKTCIIRDIHEEGAPVPTTNDFGLAIIRWSTIVFCKFPLQLKSLHIQATLTIDL